MIQKIRNEDIYNVLGVEMAEFPKYTTQILNLINSDAQGTRPNVVGQLSDMIQEFPGNTLNEWIEWYKVKQPNAINNAVRKISTMLQNFKQAIDLIDESLIRKWVEDLVLYKTFFGLKIQNIILEKLHKDYKKPTRLATKEEEAKNIDGFFGDIPIQIKPTTYKTKNALHENINIDIIYYEKKKNYIEFEIPDNLVQNSTQKKLF